MGGERVVSYRSSMKRLLLCTMAGILAPAVSLAMGACSSDENTGATPAEAGHERVIACPPATDASIAAASDAGIVAKILSPTNGQKFTTTDRVTFRGTGTDPTEGNITDKTRMIWNIGDAVKGINPDGEGPEDTAGPYAAGTYVLRFDVSNKACVTAADSITLVVE
jgi:hypothetical protein